MFSFLKDLIRRYLRFGSRLRDPVKFDLITIDVFIRVRDDCVRKRRRMLNVDRDLAQLGPDARYFLVRMDQLLATIGVQTKGFIRINRRTYLRLDLDAGRKALKNEERKANPRTGHSVRRTT